MAMFGKYFEYDGHTSNEFNVAIASMDEVDEYPSGLTRTVNQGQINRYKFRPNYFETIYEEPLQFDITLMKDICVDNDPYFTRSEYRAIASWLTRSEYPILFHMIDDEDIYDEDEYYFGVFSDIKNNAVGDIVGITATFTCDSPFAYSEEKKVEFDKTSEKNIYVNTDTDMIYPIIDIKFNGATSVSIENKTDNKQSLDINLKNTQDEIHVDCENLIIKDSDGENLALYDLGIDDPSDLYWLRLLHGDNDILVTGDVTVTFTYRECRKVGAY